MSCEQTNLLHLPTYSKTVCNLYTNLTACFVRGSSLSARLRRPLQIATPSGFSRRLYSLLHWTYVESSIVYSVSELREGSTEIVAATAAPQSSVLTILCRGIGASVRAVLLCSSKQTATRRLDVALGCLLRRADSGSRPWLPSPVRCEPDRQCRSCQRVSR